ncbi:MAG: signal peptidase I [Thermoprotei archaeon]|jgi:signal peptidase
MNKNTIIKNLAILVIVLIIALSFKEILGFILHTSVPIAVVESGSMIPTLEKGDLIISVGVDPSNLKVGDIILFKSPLNPNIIIVHRIIEIYKNDGTVLIKTKGDNNPIADPWTVNGNQVLGKVIFRIPYLGWPSIISNQISWFLPLILLAIILVIIFWPEKSKD